MIAGLTVVEQVMLGAERAPLRDEGRASTLVDPDHVNQFRVRGRWQPGDSPQSGAVLVKGGVAGAVTPCVTA